MKLYQVDAFTSEAFRGNPAAVCLLNDTPADSWMQALASEMNLAETAFVQQNGEGYRLRWFTPTVEVDLCGHATLASAHVLWTEEGVPKDLAIVFDTRSGILTISRDGIWIDMDFPALPPTACEPPAALLEGIGMEPIYVGRSKFDYLIELTSPELVRTLQPDLKRLATVDGRGAIVTSRSDDSDYHFVSRYFAPGFGIDEDSVTGSAHCALAPFWGERLNRAQMLGYQASQRGGIVRCHLQGERVGIGGQAVTIFEAELR